MTCNSSFSFSFDTDEFLTNKSAGVTDRASAILIIISNEGFALPDSIPPIVPLRSCTRLKAEAVKYSAFLCNISCSF